MLLFDLVFFGMLFYFFDTIQGIICEYSLKSVRGKSMCAACVLCTRTFYNSSKYGKFETSPTAT